MSLLTYGGPRGAAERIRGLIDDGRALARGNEEVTSEQEKSDRRQRRILDREVGQIRHEVAEAFGAQWGFRLSTSQFGPPVLARSGLHCGTKSHEQDHLWPHRFADHPYYYRNNRKAAAVAVHLYDFDAAAISAFAGSVGLRAALTPDWPSWWVPGSTALVVYSPASLPPLPDTEAL